MRTCRCLFLVVLFSIVLFVLPAAFFSTPAHATDVVISEFLAANSNSIVDEDGDHSDWVEIQNRGTAAVDLAGWYLTDDSAALERWRIPEVAADGVSTTLGPDEFLVVFASNKDRGATHGGEFHTSFRLDSSGEYLALIEPDGTTVAHEFAPAFPRQTTDLSYGLRDGEGEPGYFSSPTPGALNAGEVFAGIVADTTFSVDRGFYDEPLTVVITTATVDAEIRFTLDGTPPTAMHGTLHTTPIRVDRTTVLRAAAFREDLRSTNVDTQTYIFLDDVILQDHDATLQAGFPPLWGGVPPDYGMDERVIGQDGSDEFGGKYAATIRDDLLSIPTMSLVTDLDGIFGPSGIYTHSIEHGPEWERSTSMELIHPDGTEGVQVNCGIRMHGGSFRDHTRTRKHSLRLLFKGVHGPTKLRYPLFGDDAPELFDGIVLRANSNDGWQHAGSNTRPLYIRDAFGRQSVIDMGGVAGHSLFVHLYINGIYWGLYDVTERPNTAFSATYFGGDKDTWDAISDGGEVHDGTIDAWNTLNAMVVGATTSSAAYQAILGRNPDGTDNPDLENFLDADNYVDYMIANIAVGNTDWPGRNWWVGRNQVDSTGFKFYMWDVELSLGLSSSVGTVRTGARGGAANPYAFLRSNADFRLLFADHIHRHFFHGGAFHVDPDDPDNPERNRSAARFGKLAAVVDRALVAESARWGDQHGTLYTRDEHWRVQRDKIMNSYMPNRWPRVVEHFVAAGLYPTIATTVLGQRGGRIGPGFSLSMRIPSGRIVYTLDLTDPRQPGGAVAPGARSIDGFERAPLVSAGDDVRVLVPGDGSLGLDWTMPDFDDDTWIPGQTGVGFDTGSDFDASIGTDVIAAMHNVNATVYLRVEFTVEVLAHPVILRLRMKYDDGFVAYINGERVAARNAPDPLGWNSKAMGSHADRDAVVFENIDVTSKLGVLRPGRNLLAIHGLNTGTANGDMLIVPALDVTESTGETVTLDRTTRLLTRALDGDQWSALEDVIFAVDSSSLRITEIMFHPPRLAPGEAHRRDDFEYVELRNVGTTTLSLAGIRLEDGIEFTFPWTDESVDDLAPGEFVLVVRSVEAFTSRYGADNLPIAGEYGGSLRNSGDRIRLADALGETVLDLAYSDSWYAIADGDGAALEIIDPLGAPENWNDPDSWNPAEPSPGDGPPLDVAGSQLPGDLDQDGRLNVSDAVALLRQLFVEVRALPCGETIDDLGNRLLLDADGNGAVTLGDAVAILHFLFLRGPEHATGTGCTPLRGCPALCGDR